MAEPKKKTSKSRRNKRRVNHKVKEKHLIKCKNCGNKTLPHRICKKCGEYNK